ncbi:hypothetical protein [Chitinivorax sp. B]|uniref:hypothetical protein n=1 Tax=Chitinivorax sp. B TaxID=2502235 RepID=UPI0010F98203|nr:hypothetical protein [Chitinivorax sp. B]
MFCQQIVSYIVYELDWFADGSLDRKMSLSVVEEAAEALPVFQGDAGVAGVTNHQGDTGELDFNAHCRPFRSAGWRLKK